MVQVKIKKELSSVFFPLGQALKGQCHEIFYHLFAKKGSKWTGKNGFENFFIFDVMFYRKVQNVYVSA